MRRFGGRTCVRELRGDRDRSGVTSGIPPALVVEELNPMGRFS